jgi:hypothetical protein
VILYNRNQRGPFGDRPLRRRHPRCNASELTRGRRETPGRGYSSERPIPTLTARLSGQQTHRIGRARIQFPAGGPDQAIIQRRDHEWLPQTTIWQPLGSAAPKPTIVNRVTLALPGSKAVTVIRVASTSGRRLGGGGSYRDCHRCSEGRCYDRIGGDGVSVAWGPRCQ